MKPTQEKIVSRAELQTICSWWKENGMQVVLTNGCFDILHLGHVDCLEQAKELGDRLIVAVNSDASVRRLKGTGRPLNSEVSRLRLIAALEVVDAVVLFDEDTPQELIKEILPDVLVKGSDYTIDNIAGAKAVLMAGGMVRTLELTPGISTTGLIEKIKALNR